jgi:hypothetical protein
MDHLTQNMDQGTGILKFNFSGSKIRQRTTRYAKHESLLPEKSGRNLSHDSAQRTLKFPSSNFHVSSTTLLSGFSKKHSPFKLIALSKS